MRQVLPPRGVSRTTWIPSSWVRSNPYEEPAARLAINRLCAVGRPSRLGAGRPAPGHDEPWRTSEPHPKHRAPNGRGRTSSRAAAVRDTWPHRCPERTGNDRKIAGIDPATATQNESRLFAGLLARKT